MLHVFECTYVCTCLWPGAAFISKTKFPRDKCSNLEDDNVLFSIFKCLQNYVIGNIYGRQFFSTVVRNV